MSEQIIVALKARLDSLSPGYVGRAEARLNAIKEELQYYVLDFIYHDSEYQKWIMYGGSALRIIHGLDRMSVDLDFEIGEKVTFVLLKNLKSGLERYFLDDCGVGKDILTVKITANRGITLKFDIGKRLGLGTASDWVHVKIDLNNFVAPKTVTERRPIAHGQFSLVILVYNMSALMASKIAAILFRESRGVGNAVYGEKGRDIYDLLWYMEKRIVPDLDYLNAKNVSTADLKDLFVKLVSRVNGVSQENLKNDLTPLFDDPIRIDNWLKNWRETFRFALEAYAIRTIKDLERITINQDFSSDNYTFVFWYSTEEGGHVSVVYRLSDYWIEFRDGNLDIDVRESDVGVIEYLNGVMDPNQALRDKIEKYAVLFSEKNRAYFKKTNRVLLGDSLTTKLIRMTASDLNQKEQIWLTKQALVSCELDDLLK